MTEIAPGMMVECIKVFKNSPSSAIFKFKLGGKYFISKINRCARCPIHDLQACGGYEFINVPESRGGGWLSCCFRPYGGDKEIEREESQRTGKSADGDARNGTDHPFKFYVFDMDDK